MKSIIEILKSPNAVLGVLALALLAQMPHAIEAMSYAEFARGA